MQYASETCFKHNKPYQFIGNDPKCQLNCRICYDCLKAVDNGHKKGVSNHQTISFEQLGMHFEQLQRQSGETLLQCSEALQKYFHIFETMLLEQIHKEKQRVSKLVRRILLTGITRDEKKLETILALNNRNFSDLSCNQVASVSQMLFNYVPRGNQPGLKKLVNHLNKKHSQVYTEVREIVTSKSWQKVTLKTIDSDISFSDFEEMPQMPLKGSRVKTEEDTPKKTLRRSSVRKQLKKMDLKQISVGLKKPLQLPDSTLVEGKEQSLFLGKMFEHKSINSVHLLFRASEHDFSVKQFHRYCDNQSNTLVLVKTQFNKVIGGFTTIPWKSTANTLHADVRKQSFLFSLSLKQKMNLIDEKSAVFNSINFGPTFGAGADLAICHNGNVQKTSYSEFPYSYANSRYKESSQHSTTLFTGQKHGNHFFLKEWEVWKITFD